MSVRPEIAGASRVVVKVGSSSLTTLPGGLDEARRVLERCRIFTLAESLGGTYVSATYQDLVAFVLLALVFTFKPTGLFKEAV